MPETMSVETAGFAALNLEPQLVEALTALGYEEPTPIQREAIPPLLEGRDLLGQAATGTGKTAAFALPLLQRLSGQRKGNGPSALILVPTRELAMQVAEALHKYGKSLGANVLAVYGGQAFDQQQKALKRGVDFVVATPGRALDHIKRGTMKLGNVAAVVLDEADEMLDMGFADDLEAILSETPKERQTTLFSATMPPHIAAIAKRHLTDPVQVRIAQEKVEAGEAPRVRQTAYIVPRAYKLAALGRVLDVEAPASALIFCRTRTEVDELAETLGSRGYRPEALHGGMSQDQRDRVMKQFRSGKIDLLVATDVAARGLDIGHLSHVVNYHVPAAAEAYVHRIGRVGRAGREGVAITLAEPREHYQLRNIERVTKQRIQVEQVPTVADLHARRLELTRCALREALLEAKTDRFRVVVEALASEFDLMDIALAAVKLAHQACGSEDDNHEEIPSSKPERERDRGPRDRDDRRGGKPNRGAANGPGGAPGRKRGPKPGMTRIFLGAGREDGIGPRDLVGAIANESGVSGKHIGGIDIADRFSLVEVPEEVADYVIDCLNNTRIRGRKVQVRRDRWEERGG